MKPKPKPQPGDQLVSKLLSLTVAQRTPMMRLLATLDDAEWKRLKGMIRRLSKGDKK